MIVYVDILVLLNFLVDYFLLLLVAKLLNIKYKIKRLVFGAFVGGISALYIFISVKYKIIEVLINCLISALICLCAFGFKSIKLFLKRTLSLYIVSCLYAAIMFLLHKTFKPNGLVINNSVVFIDISPLFLVLATVIIYLSLIIFKKIFKTDAKFSKRADITLCLENNTTNLSAIIDSGNSIEDVFFQNEIIIVDSDAVSKLFKTNNLKKNKDYKNRYRLIPCDTVAGATCLEGYRIDKATVNIEKKKILLNKPVLAISKSKLTDDYQAILNPKILEYEVI